MPLYLGNSEKVKVILDGVSYCIRYVPESFIVYGIMLLSSDDYILRDINGLYLTSEEGE